MTRVRRVRWLVGAWLRRRGLLPPQVLPAGARLTTYNIGRGARPKGARATTLDRVAATIAAERPDVVALQEVHEPDVPVIVAALAAEHGLAYEATFGEAVTAPQIARRMELFRSRAGMDREWVAGRVGAYGVALLSRAPLAGVRVERLPGTGEPRVAIVARTALAGTEVTVVVTHVDTKTHAARRDAQTRAVLALAAAEPAPVVVAGDLNQEPATVAAALAATGSDLVPAGDPDAPTLGPWVIDHVLVGPGLEAVGAKVGDPGVSDHRPLTVALRGHDGR
ncbi:MAG TPA: endonuclease/exonuclease/phosphatase family protein [Iamia sp.]|nr:endonuclease/exonuclease/phosphatase family protein [Iamia sp.]